MSRAIGRPHGRRVLEFEGLTGIELPAAVQARVATLTARPSRSAR
jgi:hypothetical protein